jgi:hypothetical protein
MNRLQKYISPLILICIMIAACKANSRISGVVIATDGRPLEGANIQLLNSENGTTTDKNGFFSLNNISFQKDTIFISFMGYEKIKVPLDSKKSFYKITLTPKTISLPGVSILASRDLEHRAFKIDPGARMIKTAYIQRFSGMAIPDLYKALQNLPGVSMTNEISPQFNVRGGNFDQNLVLLDGAAIYYPFHAFGLFSSFNSDIIENADFSLGGFSAQYGNRLSSVLSINSKKVDKNFKQKLDISLIGTDFALGGNAIGASWLFSGRLSYFDLVNLFSSAKIPYRLYDGFLKVEVPLKNNSIEFFIFKNTDRLYLDDDSSPVLHSDVSDKSLKYKLINRDDLRWENNCYSLRWQAQPAKNTRLSSQLYLSNYINYAVQKKIAEFPNDVDPIFENEITQIQQSIDAENASSGADIKNEFRDISLNMDVRHNFNDRFSIRCGSQNTIFDIHYDWQGKYDFDVDRFYLFFDHAQQDTFYFSQKIIYHSLYGESIANLKSFMMKYGARVTKWDMFGKLYFEPRLNLAYDFSKKLNVTVSYGRFTQGLSTALEEGLIGFLELYFPMNVVENVEKSTHYIANVSYEIFHGYKLSASGYKKNFANLLKSTGPSLDFATTTGKAYGLECEFEGKISYKLSTFIGYSLSKSYRVFNGEKYDTNFDQRHRLQVLCNYNSADKWDLSLLFEFHSGQPYDPGFYWGLLPDYYMDSLDKHPTFWYYPVKLYDQPRGIIRYPYYHRLDFYVSKKVKRKHYVMNPYLHIRNIYNRKNVLFYKETEAIIKQNQYSIYRHPFSLGIIPTFGIKFEF